MKRYWLLSQLGGHQFVFQGNRSQIFLANQWFNGFQNKLKRLVWSPRLSLLLTTNVFMGDMSLVGPRPEREVFVKEFKKSTPKYILRLKMKAGLTGWAQVNGWRGNTSLDKRIEFDLYYIKHWSLLLDLKIICITVWKGFVNPHAY